MTEATALGVALVGLDAHEVLITADVEPCSVPEANLTIEGLPEVATREARLRLRSALGYDYHRARVRVDFLPPSADTAPLDLAIAVAILRAMGADVGVPTGARVFGELGLDGRVRPVRGALCMVDGHRAVVPLENAWEAGLSVSAAEVYAVAKLADVCAPLVRVPRSELRPFDHEFDVSGMLVSDALREQVMSAAKHERVLLVGRPGSGKTLVARGLAMRAEPLTPEEGREVARVYGAAGLVDGETKLSTRRPFRAPHHSVSEAGLVGGGERPRPGEVSLAHRGVLFLDELPEFRRSSIEALARVLDEGEAVVCRKDSFAKFPAVPKHVVASANPCPCGYARSTTRRCTCSEPVLKRHEARLESLCKLLKLERIEV